MKAIITIFVSLNLLALLIDPVLALIFLCLWPVWLNMNKAKYE